MFCTTWIFIDSTEPLKDGVHMEHLHICINNEVQFTSSEENKLGHLGKNMDLSDVSLKLKDMILRK